MNIFVLFDVCKGFVLVGKTFYCPETNTSPFSPFRGPSGLPRNFVRGGGGSTNSVDDRQNRDLGGGSPLVRGSGGSCNLVQEISFHMVKFS